MRYLARTPFGLALQGVRDDPSRMRALGYNVPLLRTLAFGLGALIASFAGILSVWWNTRISPGSIDLSRTIDVLVIAVIGGLYRLEGAWIGALVFVALDNWTRGVDIIGQRFNTVIGADLPRHRPPLARRVDGDLAVDHRLHRAPTLRQTPRAALRGPGGRGSNGLEQSTAFMTQKGGTKRANRTTGTPGREPGVRIDPKGGEVGMRVSTEGGRVRLWALLAALVLVLVGDRRSLRR